MVSTRILSFMMYTFGGFCWIDRGIFALALAKSIGDSDVTIQPKPRLNLLIKLIVLSAADYRF